MASDPMSRHYEALTAPERFALLVEAMARRDEREADRLDDTCPRRVYRVDDPEFRDRVRRAHVITLMVALNMRAGLAQLRMAEALRETSGHFAGPVEMVAQVAFLYGRAYGQWELGSRESVDVPTPEELAADVRANPDLTRQLAELRAAAREAARRVADAVHDAAGVAHAADLLAQWEGFGRFCRDALGVEATVPTAAFGLGGGDTAAEVLRAHPDAVAAEGDVERWAAEWAGTWARRFGPAPPAEVGERPLLQTRPPPAV